MIMIKNRRKSTKGDEQLILIFRNTIFGSRLKLLTICFLINSTTPEEFYSFSSIFKLLTGII